MKLMTQELRRTIPALFTTENELDPTIHAKFFTPDSNWTWYVLGFDGVDLFFGLVVGLETELGYFSLSELKSVRGPLGLPIERDLYFTPKLLSAVREAHAGAGWTEANQNCGGGERR